MTVGPSLVHWLEAHPNDEGTFSRNTTSVLHRVDCLPLSAHMPCEPRGLFDLMHRVFRAFLMHHWPCGCPENLAQSNSAHSRLGDSMDFVSTGEREVILSRQIMAEACPLARK